jgi:hypothetical protein
MIMRVNPRCAHQVRPPPDGLGGLVLDWAADPFPSRLITRNRFVVQAAVTIARFVQRSVFVRRCPPNAGHNHSREMRASKCVVAWIDAVSRRKRLFKVI